MSTWFRHIWKLKSCKASIGHKQLVMLHCERTKDLLNDVQLIDFAVSRENWLSVRYFSHNAADGPHIHPETIVS